MLLIRAMTRGMVGGYMMLSLLVAVGAMTRLNDPKETLSFLEQARWVPGAARIEIALREAYAPRSPVPQPALQPASEPAVAEQPLPQAATVATPKPAAATTEKLTPLQRLRQRTYGEASSSTIARR